VGAIQLKSDGTAYLTSSNGLVRFGSITVNGGLSGAVIVLGNVFSDFTVNGGLPGRVVVEGKEEYHLTSSNPTTSQTPFFQNDTSGTTSIYARIGLLGQVTVNGGMGSTGVLVSGGVLGDDGFEYNPQGAAGADTTGTQTTINGANSGIIAATEDVNGASGLNNTVGFFEDVAYLFSNRYANGQNLAAIDAIFTQQGVSLLFNTVTTGGYTGLALILGDVLNLHLDANGNLTGTVS
jgi:hypothetical protein